MIDPVLKKFGLSEARKSVKKLTMSSRTPIKSTPQTSSKKIHPQTQTQTQQKPITPRDNKSNQTVLQKLISYLHHNFNKICPHHAIATNRIKFVCLHQNCTQSLGCAQCFLYRHCDHPKVQIGTCIRELEELAVFLKDSYSSIRSHKSVIKAQFITQIDLEINHMCDEFHRNLQFLKNKALKEMDNHLYSKYDELQILETLRSQDRQKVTDQLLINQLIKIDIEAIERNLNAQLKELNYEKLNIQPIVKFFQEMNGALGYFMAEFKKCFPKIYGFQEDTSFIDSKFMSKSDLRLNTVSEFKSTDQDKSGPETNI